MTNGDTRLDPFETALLEHLRAATRPVEASAPEPSGGRRRRWAGLLAAGLATSTAIALTVHAVWPAPAFAVSGTNASSVVVKVNRLEGAEALERALARRGVPADITYLPEDKRCAPDRYDDATVPGMMLGVSLERFTVTIPPHAVGPHDTFVLSAAVRPIPNGLQAVVDFGIARGRVAPCVVVDA